MLLKIFLLALREMRMLKEIKFPLLRVLLWRLALD
jgi:hypothetical protein